MGARKGRRRWYEVSLFFLESCCGVDGGWKLFVSIKDFTDIGVFDGSIG